MLGNCLILNKVFLLTGTRDKKIIDAIMKNNGSFTETYSKKLVDVILIMGKSL